MDGPLLLLAAWRPRPVVLIGIPITQWQVSAINAGITYSDAGIVGSRQDMKARFWPQHAG
jgi:hypothetical protein